MDKMVGNFRTGVYRPSQISGIGGLDRLAEAFYHRLKC